MLPLILLAPLLAAIALIAILGNSRRVKFVALAGSLASLALYPLVSSGVSNAAWFSLGQYTFSFATMVTPLNRLLLLVVLSIAPLILSYSAGFMDVRSEQRRFYIEMLGFESAMLTFAMSGSVIMLFLAWEYLSLTSYLLIGFWYQKEQAAKAALKAISIILIGDIALLAAIVVLWSAAQSFSYAAILAAAQSGSTAIAIAAALLAVAIFTKSAQFPFHEWLVDAMEGPTPVSAFLHSSTMVKAGVFTAIILFPLFAAVKMNYLFILFGAVTAVISTLNAMRERHVKRVIAYSTIQELSLMLVAVGANALLAAILFFFVQSFYKALLFFSAGSMMKATDSEDIYEISGLRQNKLVFLTTLLGVLSLAGLVPLSGFFSSSAIDASLSTNLPVYALFSIMSFATSFYIFRWFFLPMRPSKSSGVSVNYTILPKPMTYSMAVMAAMMLASAAAFLFLPGFLNDGSLQYVKFVPVTPGIIDSAIETGLVLFGLALAFLIYHRKSMHPNPRGIGRIAYTRNLFEDGVYKYAAIFFSSLAEVFTLFDTYVSDSFDFIGVVFTSIASRIKYVASGDINAYVAVFSVGAIVAFAALFAYLYMTTMI